MGRYMSSVKIFLFCFFIYFTSGCAGLFGPKLPDTRYQNKVSRLSKEIKQQSEVIQTLKDENLVLRELSGFKPKTGKAYELKDAQLYSQVIQSYRNNDEKQLLRSKNILLRHFPKSIYADNAVYLAGHLNLKKGQYGESLKFFDEVIKNFPQGNKRASALFSKGQAYSKLNLKKRAKNIFISVVKTYPGSPESEKAKRELKRIN